MDFIIGFFRDVLDGPLYIIVTIVCVILICSCIGYLAEQSINKKKKKQEYDATHATIGDNTNQQTQAQTTGLEDIVPVEVEANQMSQPTPVPNASPMPQQAQIGGMTQQMPTQPIPNQTQQPQTIAMPEVEQNTNLMMNNQQMAVPQVNTQNVGIPEQSYPQQTPMPPPTMGSAPTTPMVSSPPPMPNQGNM